MILKWQFFVLFLIVELSDFINGSCSIDQFNTISAGAVCEGPSGEQISCTKNLPTGTIAHLKCRIGYKLPNQNVETRSVCQSNGSWSSKPFDCWQECGIIEEGDVNQTPWHVAIYKKHYQGYEYVCGGSIVTPSIVISAAHCFWDSDHGNAKEPHLYQVVAGKKHRNYHVTELTAQESSVSYIDIPNEYDDFYGRGDYAALHLSLPFTFTANIKPVCVDADLIDKYSYMKSNVIGRIVGWDFDNDEGYSDFTRPYDLPSVKLSTCFRYLLLKGNIPLMAALSMSKFCVQNLENNFCAIDDGAGFMASVETEKDDGYQDVYYMLGVMSAGGSRSHQCNTNRVTVFSNMYNLFTSLPRFPDKPNVSVINIPIVTEAPTVTSAPTTSTVSPPTRQTTRYRTRNPASNPTRAPTTSTASPPTSSSTSDPTYDKASDPAYDKASEPTYDKAIDPTNNQNSLPANFPTSFPTSFSYNLPSSYPARIPSSRPTETSTTTSSPVLSTCEKSVTVLKDGSKPCPGDLIFEDDFQGKRLSEKWEAENRFGSVEPDNEFVMYLNRSDNLKVTDGKLRISPSFTEDVFNYTKTNTIENCTSEIHSAACSTSTNVYGDILPPIISARINTKDYFQFLYGKVEIRAKLPSGNWIFPELFLEPVRKTYGENLHSGQMRLAFASGGPCNTRDLYQGVLLDSSEPFRTSSLCMERLASGGKWSNDFHTYTISWAPDKITTFIDGKLNCEIQPTHGFSEYTDDAGQKFPGATKWKEVGSTKMAPFDQAFYLTVGVGVGGLNDFQSTTYCPLAWSNDSPRAMGEFWAKKSEWAPSWEEQDSSLQIDYVRVYAI